jgi:hypothetical protein
MRIRKLQRIPLFLLLLSTAPFAADQMIVQLNSGSAQTYSLGQIQEITFNLSGNSIQNDVAKVAELRKVLENIFPNPFSKQASLRYSLMNDAKVTICVFDARGQKVKMLVDEFTKAGKYTAQWNATDVGNKPVASGQYIARIVINDKLVNTRTMYLLK